MQLILPSGDKISWRSAGVLVAEAEEIGSELRLLKHKANMESLSLKSTDTVNEHASLLQSLLIDDLQ